MAKAAAAVANASRTHAGVVSPSMLGGWPGDLLLSLLLQDVFKR